MCKEHIKTRIDKHMPFTLPFAVANTAIISEPKIEHLESELEWMVQCI